MLLGAVLVLYFSGPSLVEDVMAKSRQILSEMHTLESAPSAMLPFLKDMVLFLLEITMPFFVVVFVFALVGNILQFGFIWAPQMLAPDLSKLNPISGLSRIFSLRGLVRLLMSIGKLSVISAVLWFTLRGEVGVMINLSEMGVPQIARYIGDISMILAFRFVLVLIFLSLLDFGYQRYQYEQDLKMTKREVEEEMKRMEGDPQIQERIREVQEEMSRQRMMEEVPEAEVVVTNPTEYAVALDYVEEDMQAPVVVAKGKDHMADQIRSVAAEHHVPVVSRPPLARALYDMCETGDEIPEDLYEAVAEVLAYVYRLDEENEPAYV